MGVLRAAIGIFGDLDDTAQIILGFGFLTAVRVGDGYGQAAVAKSGGHGAVLLVGLAASVWSGLETYAIEENAGPLADATMVIGAKTAAPAPAPIRLASEEGEHEDVEDSQREREDRGSDDFWEEVHEVLANLTLALVIVHILGVGLASVVHRENLAGAMVTGRKRAE